MSDYTMSAEIIFKADAAVEQAKKLQKELDAIRREADKTSRKGSMSLNRLTLGMVAMSAAGAGAFGMMSAASPELASQMDVISLATEELFMVLGDSLAPIIEEYVVPMVEKLVEWFQNLDSDTQTVIATVIGLTTFIAPLSIAIGALTTVIGLVLSPIGLIILALLALYIAYETNFLGIGDMIDTFVEETIGKIKTFVDEHKEQFERIFELIKSIWIKIEPFLTIIGELFVEQIGDKLAFAVDIALIAIDLLVSNFESLLVIIDSLLKGDFYAVFLELGIMIENVFSGLADALGKTFTLIGDMLRSFGDAMLKIVEELFGDKVASQLSTFLSAIGFLLNIPIMLINTILIDNINHILNAIATIVDKIPRVSKPDWELDHLPTFGGDMDMNVNYHEGMFGTKTLTEGMALLKPKEVVRTESQENSIQRQLRRGGSHGGGGSVTNHYNFPNARFIDREGFRMFANQIDRIDRRKRTRRGQA